MKNNDITEVGLYVVEVLRWDETPGQEEVLAGPFETMDNAHQALDYFQDEHERELTIMGVRGAPTIVYMPPEDTG
jgi:hypothetical protein